MRDETTLEDYTPRPGSSAHYIVAFIPEERREAILALYALHRAVDAACEGADPGVARLKLRWWGEELGRFSDGNARHPITRTLARHAGPGFPKLDRWLALREQELSLPGWENSEHYFTTVTEAMRQSLEAWSQLLGNPPGAARHEAADRLGQGLHLCSALRRCHRMARRGHATLPIDWLTAAGTGLSDLALTEATPAVRALLVESTDRAVELLGQAANLWPAAQRAGQLSMLMAAELRRKALTLQRNEGYRRLDQLLTPTPLRKLWRAWRTQRRYRHKTA
ncbi:MAG: presqualene diphosphate synthase HpnD [Gammaproteobacteria bacterium]